MLKPIRGLTRLLNGGDEPSAVEYCVLLTLVVVACVTALLSLTSTGTSTFSGVGSRTNTKATFSDVKLNAGEVRKDGK
jgi:pilus assembly protein Flp/PilA